MTLYFSPGFALWARGQGPSWDWSLVEVGAQGSVQGWVSLRVVGEDQNQLKVHPRSGVSLRSKFSLGSELSLGPGLILGLELHPRSRLE